MARVWRLLRRAAVAVLSLAVLALALLWFSGGLRQRVEPGTVESPARRHAGEPTGRVILVHERVVESAVGTVEARQRTEVASQILATIAEIRARAGDVVRTGDVLAVLDSRELEARMAQAHEAVVAAESDAERSQADLDRYTRLLAEGVVNQAEFDEVQSVSRIAQANLARARRALEEAEVALSHAEVRAPISGRVVDRLAEPGDMAVPGEPLLTLYNPEALRLEAPVREGLATSLRVGDTMRVRIDTLALEVEGEVEEIVPQAQPGSRAFTVKVRLPTAGGLYTGMFGRLLIPAGERQRLCLPETALHRVGQLEFVDVVTEGGLVERRLVQTGEHREVERGEFHVEVLSGLSSGEVVILQG